MDVASALHLYPTYSELVTFGTNYYFKTGRGRRRRDGMADYSEASSYVYGRGGVSAVERP